MDDDGNLVLGIAVVVGLLLSIGIVIFVPGGAAMIASAAPGLLALYAIPID